MPSATELRPLIGARTGDEAQMIDRDTPRRGTRRWKSQTAQCVDRLRERVDAGRRDRRLDASGDAPVQRRETPQVDRFDPAMPEDHVAPATDAPASRA